jgi:hypothetical protein
MDEKIKEIERFIINRELVTNRVLNWSKIMTKGEICDILKISRPTLDKRLNKNNWSLSEIKLVVKNMPF